MPQICGRRKFLKGAGTSRAYGSPQPEVGATGSTHLKSSAANIQDPPGPGSGPLKRLRFPARSSFPARRTGREAEDVAHRHAAKSAPLTRPGSSPRSGEPRRRQGTFRMRPALWFDRHVPGCGQTANIHFRAAAGIRSGCATYLNRTVVASRLQVPTMGGQLARRGTVGSWRSWW